MEIFFPKVRNHGEVVETLKGLVVLCTCPAESREEKVGVRASH
jgi:hypothetical protein